MAEEPREKRERKATVEVYSIASPTKKEFVIPEGAGTKVGDIPNGAYSLFKISIAFDRSDLHPVR